VQQQLTDLQRDSLGYYALPYADPLSLHNEGPVGPAHAREAVAAWLACWLAPDAGPRTSMDR
jgi:hypothetical protein